MKLFNNLFKNKINLVLLSLLIFILYIICVNKNDNFKEGATFGSIDDIIDCTSLSSSNITCGANNYQPISGTCIDSYGPYGNISVNDKDKLDRCVDKPIPSYSTPHSSQDNEISTSTCTAINLVSSALSNKYVQTPQWLKCDKYKIIFVNKIIKL